MRKCFFIILCVGLFFPRVVLANEANSTAVDAADMKEAEAIHPYWEVPTITDHFTGLSLTIEGGINLIEADLEFPNTTPLPRTRIRPTGAISLTYDFTPIWGLSAMYSFAPYGIKQQETNDWLLKGNMQTAELLVSFDLIDAWFPKRPTNIFSLYLLGGGGLAVYKPHFYGDPLAPIESEQYDLTGVFSVGAAAEFNISRSFGLGAKALFNFYTTDQIDTRAIGSNNDYMEYVNLYLRWKMGANKRNHTRNYANDFVLDKLIDQQKAAIAQNTTRQDTIYLHSKDTIIRLADDVNTHAQWHQQVKDAVSQELDALFLSSAAQTYYVYFSNNSIRLSENSLQVIQQVAARLEAEPTICLEVVGFCDNVGSAEYNQRLGQKRADRVVQELTSIYHVDENRLFARSSGSIDNTQNAYAPNRRVELRLRSQDELQSLRFHPNQPKIIKQATEVETPQDKKRETSLLLPPQKEITTPTVVSPSTPQTPPIAETATSAPTTRETLAVVTTNQYTTFARLARQFYNNVQCWPYIYAANLKAVVNNQPDKLKLGVRVAIPQLTPDEIQACSESQSLQMAKEIQAKAQAK